MSERLNVGLVGTGRLGYLYAELLRTQIPQANLAAIAGHRAQEIAEAWGIPNWSLDRKGLINNPLVDAVIIVSSTDTHIEFIVEALDAKKPVFCEKPLAMRSEHLDGLARRIEANGHFVQIGFMRRYDPANVRMQDIIAQSEIGNPILFKSTSRDRCLPTLEYCKTSGGLLLDMAIHDFDLARWMMLSEVKSVYTTAGVFVYDELLDIGDIDSAVCVLEFVNGGTGVIDVSRCAHYGYDVHTEVLGSHGMLRSGFYRDTNLLHFDHNRVSHDIVQEFGPRYREAFRLQLEDFVNRVMDGDKPAVTFDDGLKALKIAEVAQRSYEHGERLYL